MRVRLLTDRAHASSPLASSGIESPVIRGFGGSLEGTGWAVRNTTGTSSVLGGIARAGRGRPSPALDVDADDVERSRIHEGNRLAACMHG